MQLLNLLDSHGAASVSALAVGWLIQSTLVLVVGLAVARLLRGKGASLESALLRATLVAVLLLPVAAALVAATGASRLRLELTPAFRPAVLAVAEPATAGVAPAAAALAAGEEAPAGVPEALRNAPAPDAAPPGEPVPSLAAVIAALWLCGAAVLLARLGLGLLAARAVRRRARPAGAATQARCREIARSARPPAVLISDEVAAPCLVGILEPAILLPAQHFTAGAQVGEDVLAHELAHHRRHDCAWNLLRGAGTALLFFQPLVWLLARRLERVAEHCCDDQVVSLGLDRVRYAEALLSVAERHARGWQALAALSIVPLRSTLGRRVARILDTARAVPVRIGARSAATVGALAACVTLLGGLIGPRDPAAAQDKPAFSLSGTVQDAKGEPVGAAVLHLVVAPDQSAAVATADARGAFTFRLGAPPAAKLALAAGAPKLGFAFVEIDPAETARPVVLRLGPDLPIHGRILDADGQPVAGVDVRTQVVRVAHSGSLDAFVSQKGDATQTTALARTKWTGVVPGLPERVRTDSDGRFALEGLGAERVATLLLDGPRIHRARIDVMTRRSPGEQNELAAPSGATTYFADFEHVSPLARTVRGVVTEKGTGKPIAGVVVKGISGLPLDHVCTNAEGKFEAKGCAKRARSQIDFVPQQGAYFATRVAVEDLPGLGPLEVSVELERGIVVTGKVTDAASGQPVVGEVVYEALVPNPFAEKQRDRHSWSEAAVGADGRYAIVVLPGPGFVGVRVAEGEAARYPSAATTQADVDKMTGAKMRGPAGEGVRGVRMPILVSDFKSLALIAPEEGAMPFERDFRLDRGRTIEGRVVGPDGKPIAGVVVSGLEPSLRAKPRALGSDRFVVEGLAAKGSRRLTFLHEQSRLAALVDLQPDRLESPLVVELAPCGSMIATLQDQDGKPVRDAVVEVRPAGMQALGRQRAATDAEGRLRADGLIPGVNHSPGVLNAMGFKGFVPEPGKTTDLGTITLRPEQISLPAGMVKAGG